MRETAHSALAAPHKARRDWGPQGQDGHAEKSTTWISRGAVIAGRLSELIQRCLLQLSFHRIQQAHAL